MRKSLATKWLAGLAGCAMLGTPASVLAQRELPLKLHAIKPGKLYWVEGGGGNSGIVIGDKGVVVIDAKIDAEAGRALVEEVAKLTPKPITHLIETHSDGDHVNGVVAFPRDVKIIAHTNNRAEQLAMPLAASVEIGGGKCLPPPDRIPNLVIYKDEVRATINGEEFVFHHFGRAHTTGDLIVELPRHGVVFTGDILTYNVLIHPEKNGSFDGWFDNASAILALPDTVFVPGHGREPDTKEMLRARIAGLRAKRGAIDALVDEGKTLEQAKAAMGDPPKDSIGCRGMPYPSLTWVEYHDRAGHLAELK